MTEEKRHKKHVAHIHTTKDIPPHRAEKLIEEAVSTMRDKRKHKGALYTTVKKRLNGTVCYVDIPTDIDKWDKDKYGYQITLHTHVILIRIIPKIKYSKHLLSHEELEHRLLLIKKKDIDIGPILKLTENPLTVLERHGRIVKLSRAAVEKGIHLVRSYYENPEECDDPEEFIMDHIIHGKHEPSP